MSIHVGEFNEDVARLLNQGGIGILRTDTLYGIVGRADNKETVERIFYVKQRSPTKPPISLISQMSQLLDSYDEALLGRLGSLWPGKHTVILPSQAGPEWLRRGTESVSYRLPDNLALRSLIDRTGPIIAPSANPEGHRPAMTIDEAVSYFGDSVDFYVDGGIVTDETPSKVFRFTAEGMERLR